MALTISKLKMWKDPGYTRNCLEMPPAGSKKLPSTPDYTLAADQTLRPHKGSTLTELHLPISFSQTFGMSYLYIEATDGAGSVSLFGWITSIDQRSTAAEGVTIRWDVDWWRSYSGSITWGSGIVTRCNDSTYKRPYPTHPRRWKIGKIVPLTSENLWACVVFNSTSGTPPITKINYITWQFGKSLEYNGNTYDAISLDQLMTGVLDEALGISPSAITGVFIMPFNPKSGNYHYVTTSIGKIWYIEGLGDTIYYNQLLATADQITTDDMNMGVIVDPYGSIIANVPYGVTVEGYNLYMDVGTNDAKCYLSIFKPGDVTPVLNSRYKGPIGEVLPLTSIKAPVNSNAYSEYVYSGQRDYDILTAQMQRDENRIKGWAGVGANSASGAMGGAIAGKGVGAGIGAIGGAILGGLNTEIDYQLQTGFDDWYQNAKDALYANQTSNILIGAGGEAFTSLYYQWSFVQLTADDTSLAEYTNDIALNGYETNVSTSSVSSYIAGGGPLQIINLNLTGNAPPQAKQFIKNKLQSGVYIVENNPSGVAP